MDIHYLFICMCVQDYLSMYTHLSSIFRIQVCMIHSMWVVSKLQIAFARWTNGVRSAMGNSSAYPRAFGDAIRFAHETYNRFGHMGQETLHELNRFATQMAHSLPPPGTLQLPDRVAKQTIVLYWFTALETFGYRPPPPTSSSCFCLTGLC